MVAASVLTEAEERISQIEHALEEEKKSVMSLTQQLEEKDK